MFTNPYTLRVLSDELQQGLVAEAERHRLLKAARHARRARRHQVARRAAR